MAENAASGRPARGASIVNLGLAVVAAGSLGFLVFAMPERIFSDLIVGSGLPAYLPAAEPPLGMKARGAVIAAVALFVFALVLLLLRGVDRLSARPARAGADASEDLEAPRLRRSDAHPDAPARAPLLAGRDLGGGFADADDYDYPPEADGDEMFADLPAQPLPGFLTAGRDEPGEIEQFEEPEFAEAPAEERFEAAEIEEPEQPAPEESQFEEEPEAEEEPLILDVPAAEREESHFEEEQEDVEEPLILDTTADDQSVEALVAQLPEAGESPDNSITSLMRRLETGLVRREETFDPAETEEHVSATPSWLAPQPEVEEAEAFEETGPVQAEGAFEPGEYYEAEQSEAPEPEQAFEPEPSVPAASSFPPVDEFGEPSWPPPAAEEPQFAPLGAPHRAAAGPKVQAIPPQPVESEPAEVEAPSEMSIGRRLRSAIADMEKIASTGR